MKNKVWIIIAVAFVAIMILAAVLYPKLSEKYSSGGDSEPSNETSENLVEAYDFTVYDSEMNAVKLSDKFGKPIVVNFWASWCGPCKSELPAFDAMYKKYGDEVVFMMINLTDGYNETVNGVKEFVTAATASPYITTPNMTQLTPTAFIQSPKRCLSTPMARFTIHSSVP